MSILYDFEIYKYSHNNETFLMKEDGYVSVRLPKELIDNVDEIIKKREEGYVSRAEFIKEAIRQLLRKIKQLENTGGVTE